MYTGKLLGITVDNTIVPNSTFLLWYSIKYQSQKSRRKCCMLKNFRNLLFDMMKRIIVIKTCTKKK